ncbi:MAG: peptidyl-prolyl cis-trans isomerase C [Alphaproteobacteria bacterium]|jgi:peptidyl-prolyl cis-trans isomerase C
MIVSFRLTFGTFARGLLLAGLVGAFNLAPAWAQTGGPDSVVARVNGQAIQASDVAAAIQQLPPQYRSMPPESLFKGVIEQLIDRQLVVGRARSQNLQSDAEVKNTLKQLETRVLEEVYLRRTIAAKVTDRAVQRRYERDKASLVKDKKVRARHILVKTRDEAMDILRMLARGKDFAKLAGEKSIGPSKAQGGDLGFFAREQMVPAFSAAAFSLRKGEVARAPVQTEFGWHVIKVEDIQDAAPPKFEEVKDQLRNKMGDEVVEAELKKLRAGAKVERFGMDGQPVKDGPVKGDAK